MKKGEVSVKPLVYFISFVLGLILVCIIGIKNTKALTISDYEVTWYYRNQSNESNLLNEIKPYNEPSMTVDGEYINGYSTRIEYTFTKDMQYIISYNLFLQYSLSDDSNLRNDFLTRIENNCYADSDFKVLDCTATQVSKNCGEGCDLTINVTQQVKAINSTSAIRFGVYPNSNFSLGFYNHDSTIYNYMQNINVNDNSSGAIIDQNNQMIDQNNQIIQGQDKIENSIIESNKETQNVIKDQFNSCRDSVNLFNKNDILQPGYIEENGNINTSYSSTGWAVSNYIELKSSTTYTYSNGQKGGSGTYIALYNANKELTRTILMIANQNLTFTTNENEKFVRLSIRTTGGELNTAQLQEGNVATNYEEFGEICQNKIDETNDKLDNLTGAITDSSSPNTGALENSAGWLPAGPLDSVLNLPLSLFNALTTNLNKSCNPINIPLPYVNKNITLPCINTLYNQIGITSFLSWIGVIVSGLMLYTYLLKLYKWIEDRISLNETHNVDSWGGL